MTEKGRNIAIGAFVLGAGLILLTLVIFINSGGFKGDKHRAIMVFDGSVKGLKLGAPLAFKGVQIGTVTKIDLLMNTDTFEVMMPVEVRFRTDAFDEIGSSDLAEGESMLPHLIKKGLRAQLQSQSLLTGLLYVQLDFYPDSEVRFAKIDSELEQFPTIPTDLEKISRNLEELDFGALLDDISGSLAGLHKFISDPEFQEISLRLNKTLASIETLANELNVEIEKAAPGVNRLVDNTDQAMQTLNSELPGMSSSLETTLAEANRALQQLETTMASVDYTLSDESAVLFDVREAARELAAAGRALKSLAETLEEQPESIFKGKSPLEN